MTDSVMIGDVAVGRECPAYIVAEIGINHNSNMELTYEMINAAKESGANAVKFQNYKTEDFIYDKGLKHTYFSSGRYITESQYDMFKRYELSDDNLEMIAEYCKNIGIHFQSTPTNRDGVDLLLKLDVQSIKNGSDYLGNIPLIRHMAKTQLPIVISTGMSIKQEIDEAVEAVKKYNQQLILLYCVSQYPASLSEIHLNNISKMEDEYDCIVGYSDHSESELLPSIAVSLGARWIEKHFTLSKELEGPDHSFSSTPDEFKNMVDNIRMTEDVLSSNFNDNLSAKEHSSREQFRLSCSAAKNLKKGTILHESDIAFYRPGTGMKPVEVYDLIGCELKQDLKRGEKFTLNIVKK